MPGTFMARPCPAADLALLRRSADSRSAVKGSAASSEQGRGTDRWECQRGLEKERQVGKRYSRRNNAEGGMQGAAHSREGKRSTEQGSAASRRQRAVLRCITRQQLAVIFWSFFLFCVQTEDGNHAETKK